MAHQVLRVNINPRLKLMHIAIKTMPLVSLRDAEPPVSLVPRIIFLNMDSLFALSANSKEAMEVWQRRGHHFKNTSQGGRTYLYKCNV